MCTSNFTVPLKIHAAISFVIMNIFLARAIKRRHFFRLQWLDEVQGAQDNFTKCQHQFA